MSLWVTLLKVQVELMPLPSVSLTFSVADAHDGRRQCFVDERLKGEETAKGGGGVGT